MNAKTLKQIRIRLPENLILQLKNKAKNHGMSFNAYLQNVLTEHVNGDVPYIDPDEEISPALLSMAGTIKMPSKEELDSDPRIAAALK